MPESVTWGTNNYVGSRVKLRVLQIFTLEYFLSEYRLKHGSPFNPLEGKKALHHLIFEKTKWPLHTIRELSLNDSLFIISDELRISNLPDKAREFIDSLNLPLHVYSVDDFPEADWDPKENSVFLASTL
nr:hypothetical protein [Serratia fonticola]